MRPRTRSADAVLLALACLLLGGCKRGAEGPIAGPPARADAQNRYEVRTPSELAVSVQEAGRKLGLDRFLDFAMDPVDRADLILAEARARKAAFVPQLLVLMKDQSQSRFMLLDDPAAPFGFRVEDNPFGGDDVRSLDRIAAIVALAELGATQAIPELLLALDDRDGLPAVHAAAALVRFGNRAGVPVLLAALDHKAYENENANRILKNLSGQDFGFDSDAGLTARATAVRRWRDWWAGFEKTGEQLKGEGAPYRKGQDAATDRRIARYVDVAGEFQFVFMEVARKMLVRLGPPAVPFLADGLARATGPERATWRGEIALVLGGIADPGARELLAGLARDPHPSVRSRALDALGRTGGPEAAAIVREGLDDSDASVVLAAVRALGRAGGAADAALLAGLRRSEPEVLREADFARLRLVPSPATFDAVARHVLGPSVAARTAAIDLLNALAGRTVLDDPDAPGDRRAAAVAEWRAAVVK